MIDLKSIVLGIALTATMVSCGTKGIVVRADDYDSETIVDLMNEEEPLISATPGKTPTLKPHTKKAVMSTPLAGQWIIVQAQGHTILQDGEMPYIIFSDSESKFYAYNGCNYINGNYSFNNDELTFADVISTYKMCPDEDYQGSISVVLNSGVSVKVQIDSKNRESYLYLYSNSNDLLLSLRRHNLEVINGQWDVKAINGNEIDNPGINLFFDIPELSIHGNTGCNYFNGAIQIDPDTPSAISFAEMGVTMRHCDNADIERQLLVALEQTETYSIQDDNTLILQDAHGTPMILLKKH